LDGFRQLLADVHRDSAVRDHSDLAGQPRVRLEKLELLAAQLRIAAEHLEELLGVPLHQRDARDAVAVGPHLRDILRDVTVHPGNYRHHGDERGGGENDPEQGEKAAEFAGAERLSRAGHCLPKRCVCLHSAP
jgi:hypothetical protein